MVRNRYAFTDLMDKARARAGRGRPPGGRGRAGGEPLPRGAAQPRDRHRAGHRAPAPLPRRADRGHERERDPLDGRAGAPHREEPDHRHRGARHGGGDGARQHHHRAALRRGPGRGHARPRSRPIRGCRRSISRRDARSRQRPHLLRQVPHPPRGLDRGPARGGGRPARAQRRRQEHHAQDRDGPRAPVGGQRRLRGAADRRHGAASPGPPRHRLGARGPADLPPADGDGEPAHGARPPRRDRGEAQGDARQGLRVVPGASGAAQPGRRHALGRRAADAGHRARHDARAQDHPARRADGRPDAAHGRPDLARSSRCSTTRASPSSWSSRTCR